MGFAGFPCFPNHVSVYEINGLHYKLMSSQSLQFTNQLSRLATGMVIDAPHTPSSMIVVLVVPSHVVPAAKTSPPNKLRHLNITIPSVAAVA